MTLKLLISVSLVFLLAACNKAAFTNPNVNSSNNQSSSAKSSSFISSVQVSSAIVGSSTSGKSINNQTCTYNSSANTLACSEKTYKTVTIGTQVWMAENLNYGTYIDGGALGNNLQSGPQKFCYNNTASNCNTDGGLYQWYTAMGFASTCESTSCASQISSGNHQGICPVGWHIPKSAEWDALQNFLGGQAVAGSKMKLNNTGNSSWDSSTYNNGNSSGFAALPAGFRDRNGGFYLRGNYGYFWETTEYDASDACRRNLSSKYSDLNPNYINKTYGLSVRCAKD